MLRLGHIVNPVTVPKTSDLWVAQPITFETMRRARSFAAGRVDVVLYSAQFPEDRPAVPDGFIKTRDLDRSILDLKSFQVARKLPLLRDIFDRIYEATDAEFIVYSNVDIGLMPHFYLAVAQLIRDGHDSLNITRRTIDKRADVEQLPYMYSEIGNPHPGNDCFVFARSVYPSFTLGDVCIGSEGVGSTLLTNMRAWSSGFRAVTDLHLTFHLGWDRAWRAPELRDYRQHNFQERNRIVEALRTAGRLKDPPPKRLTPRVRIRRKLRAVRRLARRR